MEGTTSKLKSQEISSKKPRERKKERKDHMFKVYVTENNLCLIKCNAAAAGMTVSAWVVCSSIQAKVVTRLSETEMSTALKLIELSNDLTDLKVMALNNGLLMIHRQCRELLSSVDNVLNKFHGHDC